MGELAIRVEKIGKQYHIGGPQVRYRTLRDTLVQAVKNPFARTVKMLRGNAYGAADLDEIIWALKDVSFDIQAGEVVGIIGRNGAGKSTLLKILTRITEPTEGSAEIHGRVGSLLEVGTGFHPELTGRENIYLNGAILGMRRVEIDKKFDEIVEFAEIDRLLDTPVKHYSSGLYVRLAFAVAAHLETEVLLIDEVLSVGDIAFQQKCLGKMGDIAKDGRTVLFVSHNMAAVENLCQRGIVINNGQIACIDTQKNAIAYYLRSLSTQSNYLGDLNRSGTGSVRVDHIEFRDTNGQPITILQSGQDIEIYLRFHTNQNYEGGWVHVGIGVTNQLGLKVFSLSTRMTGMKFNKLPSSNSFICRIPKLPLPPAIYWLSFNVKVDEIQADELSEAVQFTVAEGDFFKSGQMPSISSGISLVEGTWRLEE